MQSRRCEATAGITLVVQLLATPPACCTSPPSLLAALNLSWEAQCIYYFLWDVTVLYDDSMLAVRPGKGLATAAEHGNIGLP